MSYIKVDTLKHRICAQLERSELWDTGAWCPAREVAPYAVLAAAEAGDFDWREHYQRLIRTAIAMVQAWDVRRLDALVALFPASVPKRWRGKPLGVEIDDAGDWVVFCIEQTGA